MTFQQKFLEKERGTAPAAIVMGVPMGASRHTGRVVLFPQSISR